MWWEHPELCNFHREDPDEADEDDDDEDDDDKEEGQSWARNCGRFGVYDDGTRGTSWHLLGINSEPLD